MKKVIKANSIGDKMYNLGRVHSKLVFINSKYNKIKQDKILEEQIKSLHYLMNYIKCLTFERYIKYTNEYLSSIQQTINKMHLGQHREIFRCCCFMHGCYYKFKKNLLKDLKKRCQYDFDDFCLPLFLLELERKKIKRKDETIKIR